jgi:hypothetical protein
MRLKHGIDLPLETEATRLLMEERRARSPTSATG